MYLYSNFIGTFVFNQNLQLREKIFFSEHDVVKNFELLKEDKPLDSEKAFLEKFKNIQNLRVKPNKEILEKVSHALLEFRDEYRTANLYLTKNQVKESVTSDLLISQASDSIFEINKTINILVKRLREWYSYVLPEMEDKISDHKVFSELIVSKTRSELVKEFSIRHSMGTDLSKEDSDAIRNLAKEIVSLFYEKEEKEKYLEHLMKKTCPNITAVAGSSIGAKLISLAGSLRGLVMMPASTIQLLGAEKALFKHMVNKNIKPPKHGVIIDHPLLQRAKKEDRGKAARALGDKICLAAKIDYFKGKFIGDKLIAELEEKLR